MTELAEQLSELQYDNYGMAEQLQELQCDDDRAGRAIVGTTM